jgi:uncharacterized protein YaiI (UPF0178 family)
LFRAAGRLHIPLILVANKILQTPASPHIRAIRVGVGFDAADKAIVREMEPGDLVITADIPLAAEVIGKGGHALNPRGEFYSRETIAERLTMRNFMDELRDAGVNTGGPAVLGRKDLQAFANGLDRFLARQGRE